MHRLEQPGEKAWRTGERRDAKRKAFRRQPSRSKDKINEVLCSASRQWDFLNIPVYYGEKR